MKCAGLAALAALAIMAPVEAAAENAEEAPISEVVAPEATSNPPKESPRNFFLEINGGQLRPAVDAEPGLTGSPYRDIYGNDRMWLFEVEFDWEFFQRFGSLSVGLAAGFGTVYGRGLFASNGAISPDGTTLNTVPIRALAVYRFDWLYRRLHIPLIPFGKAGIAETLWWATNGSGSVVRFQGGKSSGGKLGYELAAGLALALNWFDPPLARELDLNSGINGAYLTAQYLKLTADNFGKQGIDLSGHMWLFGIGFEF